MTVPRLVIGMHTAMVSTFSPPGASVSVLFSAAWEARRVEGEGQAKKAEGAEHDRFLFHTTYLPRFFLYH